MSRYIDAIPLIEKWEKECWRGTNNGICQGDCFDCQFHEAIDELKDAPTVDAVPVVRCSECVHFKEWTAFELTYFGIKRDGMCKYWNCISTNKNGFCYQGVRITDGYCADGERRTDETEGS